MRIAQSTTGSNGFAATVIWFACMVLLGPAILCAQDQSCAYGAWLSPANHNMSGFTSTPVPATFNAVHVALIPHGPYQGWVLAWDHGNGTVATSQRWSLINPSATNWPPTCMNYELAMPPGGGDLFCAGHAWTKEGLLMVVGGTSTWPDPAAGTGFLGENLTYLFDPALVVPPGPAPAGTMGPGDVPWVLQLPMAQRRWYPTVTLMGVGNPPSADDNCMIVAGGTRGTVPGAPLNDYEVFDSTSRTWRTYVPSQSPRGPTFSVQSNTMDTYPRLFALSSGDILMAGEQCESFRLKHLTTGPGPGSWTGPMGISFNGQSDTQRLYGSAFLLPGATDVVAILGGRLYNPGTEQIDVNLPPPAPLQSAVDYATASVQYCFASAAGPGLGPTGWNWATGPPMSYARYHCNATICPDGSVIVTGGHTDTNTVTSNTGTPMTSTFVPERYWQGLWTSMPPGISSRNYHATALLLADASILVAGGEGRSHDYELLLPPYLTCGQARPTIISAPTQITYNTAYPLAFANPGIKVRNAVLVRPGSVTHHTNYDQRHVDLALNVLNNATGQLAFVAPQTANDAPRGWYMLFIVSTDGVPSVASWVLLQ